MLCAALVLSAFVDELAVAALELEADELEADELEADELDGAAVALVVVLDDSASLEVLELVLVLAAVLDVVILAAGETFPGSSSVPAHANEAPALSADASRVW